MRPKASSFLSILLAGVIPSPAPAQSELPGTIRDAPLALEQQLVRPTFVPPNAGKRPGPYSVEDWREIIDETWGDGLPIADELLVFDEFWNLVDTQFACFHDLDVDWEELRQRYRPEILSGVSRGRFAAIMNHLALAVEEAHTQVLDPLVNLGTYPGPGVPLMFVGGWGYDFHFGACLTPLPDKSLLVYDAVPGHPLGLEPGDRVLGYDGVPWRTSVKTLLAAELPLSGTRGSSPSTLEHAFLVAAGRNWHLFDTMDVVKFGTSEPVHVPTSPMTSLGDSILCSESLDVPGVPEPDLAQGIVASYGILEGTRIGYIYVWGWFGDVQEQFRAAVEALMFEHDTEGLIIDFRLNFGGNMFLSNPGLALLFDETVETVGFAVRADPDDHYAMFVPPYGEPPFYAIPGDPGSFYDRPIAVLTGPGALSSGDQVALRMKFHPMARLFGRSTNTAFNSPMFWEPLWGWSAGLAVADAFLADNPGEYLTHERVVVDQLVWLRQRDVRQGRDTVVEAARRWIQSRSPHAIPGSP